MHPVETYLRDCQSRHRTGALTPETTFYAPLETLLNTLGHSLKPRVHCYMSLKNQGGNMPDGGLFTPDQIEKGTDQAPIGTPPARGVVECKPPKDNLLAIADSAQVSRYWEKFNQVLVTNYREFVLIGRDGAGQRVRYEHFQLAESEKAFWKADPVKLAAEYGDTLLDFLKRVLLRPAPVASPKDVAWFLASYAREAKARVERASNFHALDGVRNAMEQALGVSFADHHDPDKGGRFFRSTLVQTLFYGVFSAWVLWHKSGPRPGSAFDWEKASGHLRVPVIRKLFRELTDPEQLKDFRLDEVLGWAADVLNRVDRTAFFETFNDSEAVQYFYEPFLEQFDPELRKQLGVWYTPPEVVKYMVNRVDQVLRDDLGIEDGLAAENVTILDPCCGTGAYLVEVLRHIDATLKANNDDATSGAKLKEAALNRVFGFELLPAPFVVAHLQLGLTLTEAGAPLSDAKKERAGVYLTNALTGWQPPTGAKKQLPYFELEEERDLANGVKRGKKILVVIGNPPYNGFAGVAVEEERDLSDAYRGDPKDPAGLKPQGQGLNDLYIRFFRMAERCILGNAEGRGVVCFISNYSWLDGLSFPVMRQKLLEGFDSIWIDSLNGDKYKTGKLTPDGMPDPSVFSTERNREGIQVGTAVATLVRTAEHKAPAVVRYRDFWGVAKRAEIFEFGKKWNSRKYEKVKPAKALGFPFRRMGTATGFTAWPRLPELFPTYFTGVKTSRDDIVVDIDRGALLERIKSYFDRSITHEELKRVSPRMMEDMSGYAARPTRDRLLDRGMNPEGVVPFAYRPFDRRWLYWEGDEGLVDRPRPEYVSHVFLGNLWFAAVQQNRKGFDPSPVHQCLSSLHIIERGANVFPMLLREQTNGHSLFGEDSGRKCHEFGDHCANITDTAFEYLKPRGDVKAAESLFYHTIAQLHAPGYSIENSDALRQDWPRVPLPNDAGLLKESAILGKRIAALLDSETPVVGITRGKLETAFKVIGVPTKVGGGQFDAADLAVAARWGIAGKGGICMPGPGKAVERAYTPEEKAALGDAIAQLGDTTFDVYLNERAYWRNVPARVWEYTLGGYQVLKKWLSYREEKLLGRALKLEEVEHVRDTARRIAALRMLGPALDANYAAVKADLYEWPPAGG